LSWLALEPQEQPVQQQQRELPVPESQPEARREVPALPQQRPELKFQPLELQPLAQPS
jgi:hypothetical protein